MSKHTIPNRPRPEFVAELPNLITAQDYAAPPHINKARLRITLTDQGIEILGDCPHPALLESLLAQVGAERMEMMLCG